MEKLNVGCGTDYKEGWVNLDFNKKFKHDVYFDLSTIYKDKKMPFKDNTFDLIILYHVIEHLPEPLPILRELYRICKKGPFQFHHIPETLIDPDMNSKKLLIQPQPL